MILNIIGVIYLLVRYNQVKQFIEYYTNIAINEIIKQNNILDKDGYTSIKIINLIRFIKKLSFTRLLFSFKPLKLRYFFTKEEIILLNRKIKN